MLGTERLQTVLFTTNDAMRSRHARGTCVEVGEIARLSHPRVRPKEQRDMQRGGRMKSFGVSVLVVTALSFASGCKDAGGFFCSGSECGWSDHETSALVALGGMPTDAPADTSNKYATSVDAAAFGKQLYFDTRFSGPSTQVDALNRPMPFGRVAKGQPTAVSCASCH